MNCNAQEKRILRKPASYALALAAIGTMVTGCVDHDYDLSKDIDMTVTVGGNELTLPASSTAAITLSEILNLDENSSLQPLEADMYGLKKGDYVVREKANPSHSTISIDEVNLSSLKGSTDITPLPKFVELPGSYETVVSTGDIHSDMHISDDNVTRELVSLVSAETDLEMDITVFFKSEDFTGTAYIKKGYQADFSSDWTIQVADAKTASLVKVIGGHTLEFLNDTPFGTESVPLTLKIKIVKFDLSHAGAGQGLYAPGKFKLDSEIVFSGDVAIHTDALRAHEANLTLVTKTEIPVARLLAVTGKIDPKITIDPTRFEISGVPDYMNDPKNNLDVANPMLFLTVTNNSPVKVNVWATLKAQKTDDSLTAPVVIGSANAPIQIKPNAVTEVCVCRTLPAVTEPNVTYVQVSDLSTLFESVPKEVIADPISAKSDVNEVVTIRLSSPAQPVEYSFVTDYDVVVPLAFGDNLEFYYDTTENWDDEDDLDKYNFDEVDLSFDAVSTLPLDLVPRVEALDADGNVISNVYADVNGSVKAGNVDAPSTGSITAKIHSTAGNIKNLKGVRVYFNATNTAASAGKPLNENQSIAFKNILISVKGGVTIDLN